MGEARKSPQEDIEEAADAQTIAEKIQDFLSTLETFDARSANTSERHRQLLKASQLSCQLRSVNNHELEIEGGKDIAKIEVIESKALEFCSSINEVIDSELAPLKKSLLDGSFPSEEFYTLLASASDYSLRWSASDYADVLVNRLFGYRGYVSGGELPKNMRANVPLRARHILKLCEHLNIGAGDDVYDIGGGYGRIMLTISVLTGANCFVDEYSSELCDIAKQLIVQHNIKGVTVRHGDARYLDYANGGKLILYEPFYGPVLEEFLHNLRINRYLESQFFLAGFCTDCVEGLQLHFDWLEEIEHEDEEFFGHLFRSKSP